MHTEVHIAASVGRSPRIRAGGGLAVRRTGVDAVHLISTAATPLGGDHIDITVEVADGARLCVSTVAAMIALPSRTEPRSTARWTIVVGAHAELVLSPLPTIVAADAEHVTTMTVTADPTATIDIDEHVQLGRHGESGGRWAGRLHVDLGGTPALRHQVVIGGTDPFGAPDDHRALVSAFRHPDPRPAAVSATRVAARLNLECGGSLTTAVGRSLTAVTAAVSAIAASSPSSTPQTATPA